MATCGSCGASFNEATTRCPYCGSGGISVGIAAARSTSNAQSSQLYKAGVTQAWPQGTTEVQATTQINSLEIETHVLDAMTIGALEVAPKETAGVLFGRVTDGLASVRHAQVIQEALIRTAYSTAPSPMSSERIAEAEKAVIDLEFLGSYHSHPYFLQAFDRPEDGLSLSEGDQKYLEQQPRTRIEMILGYFPWQIWRIEPGSADWHEESAALRYSKDQARQAKILIRSLDYAIPSSQILQVIKEGYAWAQQQGDQSYAQMMQKEMEQVSQFSEIRGFDIRVACHSRTSDGFQPVPVAVGYSPSSAVCPACGASIGTGETRCGFCGASF